MKTLVSVLLCLAMALSVSAQGNAEHMKFMGIPLTGTINSFQAKLLKKGCRVDKIGSKATPAGCRVFEGTFAGHEAQIFIYYDKDSKTVYRAKAIYKETDSDIAANKYSELESMLRTKYSTSYISDGTQDGYDALSIDVVDNDSNHIGRIDLYRADNGISVYNLYSTYSVHIDYYDGANNSEHIDNKMDDL